MSIIFINALSILFLVTMFKFYMVNDDIKTIFAMFRERDEKHQPCDSCGAVVEIKSEKVHKVEVIFDGKEKEFIKNMYFCGKCKVAYDVEGRHFGEIRYYKTFETNKQGKLIKN